MLYRIFLNLRFISEISTFQKLGNVKDDIQFMWEPISKQNMYSKMDPNWREIAHFSFKDCK